jgi:CBS domain containing-hemolysin-like protein
VPATGNLRTTLQAVQAEGAHLAAVTENGTVPGVVALEDILEEPVGEIRDAVHR